MSEQIGRQSRTHFVRGGYGAHTVLEMQSALDEPGVLGHFLDEFDFGQADGIFIFDELVEKLIVFLLAFEGENAPAACAMQKM